jgi:multisubunit Na+/H+ antiporter MnhB subunit
VRTVESRRADWMTIVGTLLSVVAAMSLLAILFTSIFPTFSPTKFVSRFVESSGNIGQETSSLLWGQRYLDLIAQAFLVLASAACCIAMLKPKGKEEKE